MTKYKGSPRLPQALRKEKREMSGTAAIPKLYLHLLDYSGFYTI